MMNCLSIEEMYAFIDGQMQEKEMHDKEAHFQSCATCSALFSEMIETEHVLSNVFPPVNVEATFTNEVMDKLTKKKMVRSKKRDWRAAFATVFVTAALIVLVFSSLQKEPVTSSPSVSLSLKDIEVTDVSITVTVATSGYDGNESFYNDSNRNSKENNIEIILPNGRSVPFSFSIAKQSMNEMTYEFDLFDVEHEDFTILFSFTHIFDIFGQWSLEVPIDRTELLAKTKNIPLNASFEKDGIDVKFIHAQHGPYNSRFKFETKFTEDMEIFVEKQVEKYTADLPVFEKEPYGAYNAQILFNVINADGQTLQRSIPEDTISINDYVETLTTFPTVQEGGYIYVIGAKFELPTNVRHELTMDQLPYSFTYKDTVYDVKRLADGRLEISSDLKSTTINNWQITANYETAWDTAQVRTDEEKNYVTITLKEDLPVDSFILYGQTEEKYVYFDEAVRVDLY